MKIFITGAAGYIGGSVAEKLVAKGHQVIGLVRSLEKADALISRGIEPAIGSLDDAHVLTRYAQLSDAVIHAADVDHGASVVTLVNALERSGKLLIHTSGTSIVADQADGEFRAEIAISEDMYFEPLPFRKPRVEMNRFVREAAIGKGIRAVVICPSMIYGTGRGLQADSDQIPKLIELSRQTRAGVYFGKGENIYSNVHIDDLVDLYLLAMEKASGGSFFFAENGHNSFREIAGMISHFLGFDGNSVSIPVEYVHQNFGEAARLGVASNSYVSAMNARRIGWKPRSPSLSEWFQSSR